MCFSPNGTHPKQILGCQMCYCILLEVCTIYKLLQRLDGFDMFLFLLICVIYLQYTYTIIYTFFFFFSGGRCRTLKYIIFYRLHLDTRKGTFRHSRTWSDAYHEQFAENYSTYLLRIYRIYCIYLVPQVLTLLSSHHSGAHPWDIYIYINIYKYMAVSDACVDSN